MLIAVTVWYLYYFIMTICTDKCYSCVFALLPQSCGLYLGKAWQGDGTTCFDLSDEHFCYVGAFYILSVFYGLLLN